METWWDEAGFINTLKFYQLSKGVFKDAFLTAKQDQFCDTSRTTDTWETVAILLLSMRGYMLWKIVILSGSAINEKFWGQVGLSVKTGDLMTLKNYNYKHIANLKQFKHNKAYINP